MKRQFAIFLFASALVTLIGLTLIPRTLADLAVFYPVSMDMNSVVITLNPGEISTNTSAKLVAAEHVLSSRLEQLKVDGSYTVEIKNNQLQVVLPRTENAPYIANLVLHVGEIEFISGNTQFPTIGEQVVTSLETALVEEPLVYYTLFTGQEINQVVPPGAAPGDIFYRLTLAQSVVDRIDTFNPQQSSFICIVLDKEVTHCSTMYHLSGNTLDILLNVDNSTSIDPIDLAVLLNSGPLPMPLEIVNN